MTMTNRTKKSGLWTTEKDLTGRRCAIWSAFWLLAALLLTAWLPPPSARAQTYAVTDLGTLGGDSSEANSINNSGQVVGVSKLTSGASHAFRYSSGQMQDLGTLGGDSSEANGINTSGQVVGQSYLSDGSMRAFRYSSGQMVDLGTLGGSAGIANSINDSGQIAGTSVISGSFHAFLYSSGQMVDLGTLGGSSSNAYGINAGGQVVGYSQITNNSDHHAFLYDNGQMVDIGTLGGTYSIARGINAGGQIVGFSRIAGGALHAFRYSSEQMVDLGTLGGTTSRAYDINTGGQIVGFSNTIGDLVTHAFVYSNGQMVNLNTLLPPGSGWVLNEARGINNSGQIVGKGTFNGQTRAFLLTSTTVNTPPVAVADSYSTDQDTTLTVGVATGVLSNDSDADSDPLTAVLDEDVTNGTLTLNSDGSFTYAPNGGYSGEDSFTYHANDGQADSNIVTVTITVNDVAEAPSLIVTTTSDVIANDGETSLREAINAANADSDASDITFASGVSGTIQLASQLPDLTAPVTITGPAAGVTIAGLAKGFFVLTVNSGVTAGLTNLTISSGSYGIYNRGTATFTNCTFSGNNYGIVNQGTATVTNCTISGNSTYGLYNEQSATITNSTLSGNYQGVFNDPTAVSLNLKNSLVVGNTFNISATYTNDGGNIATGTAAAAGLDPDGLKDNGGPTHTIALLENSPAIDAALSGGAPATDQRGVARPQGAGVDIGAFEFESETTPQPPTVTDISKTVNENASLTFAAADFDAGFSDPNGDTLTAIKVTSLPTSGVLQLGGVDVEDEDEIARADIADLTYTPNANYNGADSFGWNGSDGTAYAATSASVNITINAVNSAPVLSNIESSALAFTAGDGATAITASLQVSDADSTTLSSGTVSISAGFVTSEDVLAFTNNPAAHGNIAGSYNAATGVLSLTSAGATATLAEWQAALRAVTYNNISAAPTATTRTVSFGVNDGTNNSNSVSRNITVGDSPPVNTAPVAVADSYDTDQDTTLTVDAASGVLSNDSDADAGDTLTTVLDDDVAHGDLTLNDDGSFTYEPDTGFVGEDSFTYHANDGTDDSNIVTVTITVTDTGPSENTAPVLDSIGNKTIDELQVFSFQATAEDGEDNVLTFSLQNAPQGASITEGGLFSWTPSEAQGPGSYTFTVRVSDGELTDEEQITIAVREVNSSPNLDLGSNRTVTGGVPFSFGITASDSDIPQQGLGVYPIAPTPNWIGLTNGPTIYGTAPVSNAPYTVTIAIRAGDSFGANTDKSIQLTVLPVPKTVTWTVTPTFNASEGTITYRLKNNTSAAITGVYVSGHFRVQPISVSSNIGTTSWNNQGNGYYGVYWHGFNVAPGQEKVLTVKVARPATGVRVANGLYAAFGPGSQATLLAPKVIAP